MGSFPTTRIHFVISFLMKNYKILVNSYPDERAFSNFNDFAARMTLILRFLGMRRLSPEYDHVQQHKMHAFIQTSIKIMN